MCPIQYYDLMRQSKDPRYLRLQIVQYADAHGIKPAAQRFSTTVKTVRKWLRRWRTQNYAGLEELSRAPHNPVRQITTAQRRQAIRLKRKLRSWGACRMKREYGLALSEKALRRIWREQGLLKTKTPQAQNQERSASR